MIKKIISFVFLSLTISLLHSCIFPDYNYKEHLITSGDFKYIEGRYPNDEGYVYLIELSEEGLKKDTIVVPLEIDGKPVKGLGYSGRNEPTETHAYFKLFGIKRIYIPATENLRKNNIYVDNDEGSYLLNLFVPDLFDVSIDFKNVYAKYSNIIYKCNNISYYSINENIKLEKTNVAYYIFYGTRWGAYFVDDCDGTTVNVIPPNPTKKGYRFDGWYKDKDFVEKWDFEIDIVPPKQYDEDGNYIYQETSIYAKFTYIEE